MSKEFDFESAILSDGSSVEKKEKPLDHKKYLEYQKELKDRFQDYEKEEKKRALAANLLLWDSETPYRLKGSRLSKFSEDIQEKAGNYLKNSRSVAGVYIQGKEVSGLSNSSLGYSILRKLVGAGRISPSKVLKISETEIVSYAKNGFQGQNDYRNRVLQKDFDAIIVEGIGNNVPYSVQVENAFNDLIHKIYYESILAVFCGSGTFESWTELLTEASDLTVREVVGSNLISCDGPEEKPKDKRAAARLPLDKFKD